VSVLRAGSKVQGTDGDLGTVHALVVDPVERRITHLVVGLHELLSRRFTVGADRVVSSTPDVVVLDLDRPALEACPVFDEPDFNEPADGYGMTTFGYEPGALFLEPFASPVDGYVLSGHERIPKDEITLRRGDVVVAGDGRSIGHVDELLVDPDDGSVTHVVLREGGLFKRRDVVVPLAGARFEEGQVVLDLDVVDLDTLERIPVKRHGHVRPG
jgi:sporulation protein YlmC with PRC-barrel domain